MVYTFHFFFLTEIASFLMEIRFPKGTKNENQRNFFVVMIAA